MKRSKSVRTRRRLSLGFTLVELMVVVIIIGVSAALTMPAIVDQMRQRNLRETALTVASIYSEARMRALARGSAVAVVYTQATGWQVIESIDGAAVATQRNAPDCSAEPGLGCLTNSWATPGLSRNVGDTYKPQAEIAFTGADATGNATTALSVCFSPMGRSFFGPNMTSPLQPLVGSPVFTLVRAGSWGTATYHGYPYYVAVLPNGIARLTRGGPQ